MMNLSAGGSLVELLNFLHPTCFVQNDASKKYDWTDVSFLYKM